MSFLNYYTLHFEYKRHEDFIRNVFADEYSYTNLLFDVHSLFKLKSEVVDIEANTGLKIEDNMDLLLLFDFHKDKPNINLKVMRKFAPLCIEMPFDDVL